MEELTEEHKPDLDKQAFKAGHIMVSHSFFEKVQAAAGYFSLEKIFDCNVVQA